MRLKYYRAFPSLMYHISSSRIDSKMSLKTRHPRKDSLLSKRTPFISSVPNRSASPLRMEETLPGLLYKAFISLALYSHSYRLMANMTLSNSNITGWAVLHILRNMSYDSYKGKFPYQDGNVNNWFEQQALTEDHATGTINMLNLREMPGPDEYPRLDEAVFPPSGEEVQGFTMLYHGTEHNHAQSILKRIRLSASKGDGDFSCRDGFYVTKKFERAPDYAFCSGRAAVLCYKMPDDVLKRFGAKSKYLVGRENEEEWVTVVKDIERFIRINDELSFIEGPEMRRDENDAKTFEQKPNTHQMCILQKEMAKAFDKHLHSVVFYITTSISGT